MSVSEPAPAAVAAPPEGSADPLADLPLADRPELQLAIAFGAAFVLAKVLKSVAG